MSAKLANLHTQRAKAWAAAEEIRATLAEDGTDPAEATQKWNRALDDVDVLDRQIEAEKRYEAMKEISATPVDEARDANPVDDGHARPKEQRAQEYREAFLTYMRHGSAELSREQRDVLRRGFDTTGETRALAAGTDSAGGYTVPTEFSSTIIRTLKAFGGLASLARPLNTADGRDLVFPTGDDTSNVGAIVGENVASTEQDTAFGSVTVGAFKYSSKIVRVPYELLEDSSADIEGYLAEIFAERIGRVVASHAVSGNGSTQPQGITTASTGLATGVTAAISYDSLVDLEHSLDPAYRNERAQYVLSDSALKATRKLKDTTGRPIWVPSPVVGAPNTLNGRPYLVDNSMPDTTAGNKAIAYGDFQTALVWRRVTTQHVLRLVERYAEFGQVAFLNLQRHDVKILQPAAAKVLVTA